MQDEPDGPLINVKRLRELLEYLTAHPEEHDQNLWATRKRDSNGGCMTACCAAGWAVALSEEHEISWRPSAFTDNLDVSEYATSARGQLQHIRYAAQELLGFTTEQAYTFFDSTNSLYRLWGYASRWTNQEIVRPESVVPSGLQP